MKVNEEVTITPKENLYKNKKGEDKKSLNVYINYNNIQREDGKNESTGYIPYSEVPKLEKVEKHGKVTWNSDKADDFYYTILKTLESKFDVSNTSDNNQGVSESTSQDLPKVEASEAFSTIDEHDDLPF